MTIDTIVDNGDGKCWMSVRGACGHQITFLVNPRKAMSKRIDSYRQRRCDDCVAADNQDQLWSAWMTKVRDSVKARHGINKGEEASYLPPGTTIALRLAGDRYWTGELRDGKMVICQGGPDVIDVVSRLARVCLMHHGIKIKC